MYKIIILSFFIAMFNYNGIQKNINFDSELLNRIGPSYTVSPISLDNYLQELDDMTITEESFLHNDSFIGIIEMLFLIIMTVIIVITPLVLVYFWAYYSLDYLKRFKKRTDLKDFMTVSGEINYKELPISIWIRFRKTYSKMVGFGLSILAWSLASNTYIFKNFDEIDLGLKDYFRFPFKVLNSLGFINNKPKTSIPLTEVWLEMIYIVIISIVVFFAGYYIGKFIINMRYQRPKLSNG